VQPPSLDPRTLVAQFNECINSRNLAALTGLMTDDHVFIDTANAAIRGKQQCVNAWRGFFDSFPDYRNIFDTLVVVDDVVIVVGRSTCSDARLAGPALWSAKTRDAKLSEWRVYEDTPANRSALTESTRLR
jgi:ketosteroid isomerase-like protein